MHILNHVLTKSSILPGLTRSYYLICITAIIYLSFSSFSFPLTNVYRVSHVDRVTSPLSSNEKGAWRLSSPPKVSQLMHDILGAKRTGTWLGCVIHWSGQSNCEHANTGQHKGPAQEKSPPAGYNMQPKVERSLRNIIMMFVTADDSARVENKRGASGSVPNGAEEWS